MQSVRVHYQVPQGYSVFSSAEQDAKEGANNGTVSMKHIKEFYMAIVKDMMVKSTVADGVSIRVIGSQSDAKKIEETLEVKKVLSYFKQKFGPYPFKQLDIVINGGGMEYPGIVEVNTTPEEPAINETVVHETAHQWFYHVVSNAPYYHAWIDEGLTSLSTMLYFINVEKTPVDTIMEQLEML
ncbi:M1 family aminopeptidase [Neobacillus sp. NPDC093127]|uniref:M1 family aminopeptidase n=1 Tax=Neobacillus sp. NPDC093127 TaxID=3364296 RepID=UPI0037FE2D93